MKKVWSIILIAMMVMTAGCSATQEQQNDAGTEDVQTDVEEKKKEEDITIAFIVKSLENQFFTDTQEGAQARAEELGVSINFLAPAGGQADIEGEVQLMEDSIIKGVDAIVLDVVYSVNEKTLTPEDQIISAASCPPTAWLPWPRP